MKRKAINSLLALFLIYSSCDENGVFDQYQSFESEFWRKSDTVAFEFLVTDTIQKHNLFIALRNNQKYEFSNLFLISELSFPNGKVVVDTLEYRMTDASGRFLGSGLSTRIENKLFYKERQVFPLGGNYHFSVRHAMREAGNTQGIDTLNGITDLGLRIELAE